MKVFGVVIVVLGLVIAYIGITGSQHRVMAILKGTKVSAPTQNSSNTTRTVAPSNPANGQVQA